MRHDVAELARFPGQGAIRIPVSLIKKLSPDSHSIMEFKSAMDMHIAEKMLKFPRLGERITDTWNLVLGNEFHMTSDSKWFKTVASKDCLPLFEGKMIHQFEVGLASPRYWVHESDLSVALKSDLESIEQFRLVHRSIARSTDSRTMIASIISPKAVYGHSLNGWCFEPNLRVGPVVCALLNSFVFDWYLRASVSANLTMFFVYQTPVPRLDSNSPNFLKIGLRAARLICTTSEYDDLAKAAGIKNHKFGATDPDERARLRAELDGLIAHLYDLTEEEFAHILATFPLVPDAVKVAARNAYRDVERGLIK
jgi:hypothetical protein